MFKNTAEYANIAGMSLEDFTKPDEYRYKRSNDSVLIGAKGSAGGFGELANTSSELGMDGVRATTVLGALAANIDKLRENQKFSNEEFIKGTSLLIEYNKKNSSAQAMLEKAAKKFKEIQVELGEKLTPIYASTIHKASTLLKVFGATVTFLFKYGNTILFATGYLITYTAAVKILAMWEARKNTQIGIGLALTKTQSALAPLLAAINIAAMKLEILFMGKKTAAQIAHIELLKKEIMHTNFWSGYKATPIGIVFTAIAGLILAIRAYDK
ncbi:MAG: hypothetical protein IPF54_26515 [Draconibacterium sp.]|nr:hypothetical protein [Draconibacterium sp.]